MVSLIHADSHPQSQRMLRQVGILAWVFLFLFGCAQINPIQRPSEKFDHRIKHIIIHYTSQDLQTSLTTLTKSSDYPVSSHYLISSEVRGRGDAQTALLYQLVNEQNRAWHAGISTWGDDRALNTHLLGLKLLTSRGANYRFNNWGIPQRFTLLARLSPLVRRKSLPLRVSFMTCKNATRISTPSISWATLISRLIAKLILDPISLGNSCSTKASVLGTTMTTCAFFWINSQPNGQLCWRHSVN